MPRRYGLNTATPPATKDQVRDILRETLNAGRILGEFTDEMTLQKLAKACIVMVIDGPAGATEFGGGTPLWWTRNISDAILVRQYLDEIGDE